MRVRLITTAATDVNTAGIKTALTPSRPALRSRRTAGRLPRPGQPPTFLRTVAAVLLLSCLWSFGVAPIALAAHVGSVTPRRVSLKRRVVTPMTAAELSRRIALAQKSTAQRLAKAAHGRRKPGLPTLQEFIRRNQAAQQNATRRALVAFAHRDSKSPGSLLDEVGHLAAPVPPATVAGWKRELHAGNAGARRAATLHLWLGEYLLAHDQHPQAADPHFLLAEKLTSPKDPIYGLAAYDVADGLFYDGAYAEAADRFAVLLDPKTASPGYDRANCALWLRHARACAGYHAQRANLGIPEPPRLDRFCAAAALATCLRGLGLPSDRKTVLAACKVTGEGSTLQDVVDAHTKLGVNVRTLMATDEGLQSLPMPLVAFVENDHFIAVTGADKAGVTYLCSDCGAWPGGRVRLSWKQWHALSPGLYAAVTKPGTEWDQTLAAQPGGDQPGCQPLLVAMTGSLGRVLLHVPARPLLRGVRLKYVVYLYIGCGYNNRFTLHCADCLVCCIVDFLLNLLFGSGAGDPVNLATGEEQYAPAPDLTVYNPHGPAVSWGRIYNSLRSNRENVPVAAGGGGYYQYEAMDFGTGWSNPYNVAVVGGISGNGNGMSGSNNYLMLANGAHIWFTAPSAPTAAQPAVQCAVQPGAPLLVEWDYDAGSAGGHYTVTWKDRTRWVTGPPSSSGYYQLSQILDRNGNFLTLHYAPASNYVMGGVVPNSSPLLTSITNQDGTALLTLTRNRAGNVVAASDNYGRSVYYHTGWYGGYGSSFPALDYVSQVVPSCTANPPARYVYGYQVFLNPEGLWASPVLHTISVPSPKGDGSISTATINYDSGMYVRSLVDSNGNTHSYTDVDANHEKVTVTDKSGNVAYSWIGGFNSDMSGTGRTDGAGRTTSTEVFSDPNDAYRPSAVLDGNASQAYPDAHATPGQPSPLPVTGAQVPTSGSGWDIVSPSGGVIASTASPSGWAVSYTSASGNSSPTTSSSSILTVTAPASAPVGAGYRVRYCLYAPSYASATFDIVPTGAGFGTTACTWDSFGNMTSMTSVRGVTTTYTYDYSHFALGELTKVQEGTKTSTKYVYDETDGYLDANGQFVPCGLVTGIATPTPGSAPGSGLQVVMSFTYDDTGQGSQPMGSLGLGNPLVITAPGNNATITPGAPGGNPTIANGYDSGIKTTFTYPPPDANGKRQSSIGEPLTVANGSLDPQKQTANVTQFRYDPQGQAVSVIDALGHETDRSYNENGGTLSLGNQLQSVTLPATAQTGSGQGSVVTTYLYPGGPALAQTISDENGKAVRQVSTAYGSEGETLSVSGSTEPVTYTYDGLYRTSTLKDGGGHVTSYFYNAEGYLAQLVYSGAQATPPNAPLSAGIPDTVTFNSYDADGNLTSRTDGRNQTTTYSYVDPESKLTDITYSTGTLGPVHFNYDAYGRRGNTVAGSPGMTDGTGSQAYAYDDANNQTAKTVAWAGVGGSKTITYAYYPGGKRSGMTADGQTFFYGYDNVGRMTGLSNPFSEASAWAYGDNGWLAMRTLNNGTGSLVAKTTYTRNQLGQVTDLLNQNNAGATLSEYGSMAYDGSGNRTTLNANVASNTAYSGTMGYTYDSGQTATASLNRSQLTQETGTRGGSHTYTYAYDGGSGTGPGNPTSFKGTTNTFNADNQLTGTGYGYDGAGNPTTYNSKSLAFDPENRMTQYGPSASPIQQDGYDGAGLRAWKSSAGGTTYFLYDGTQPVCEYNGSGSLTATNTFGADGLISRHSGGATTFYAFDERGNVSARLNSSGTVQSSDLYDGYGAKSSTAGGDVWDFGAQVGYYTDVETGLILCTHRLYDPSNGRWLNRDPIGYRGGINLYAYTADNPISRLDPSGLFWDISVTIGPVVIGVQIDDTSGNFNPYVGASAGVGAGAISVMRGAGPPTPGGFIQTGGGCLFGGNYGYGGLGTNKAGWSGESGFTTPTWGVQGGYVFPTVANPWSGTPGFPGGPSLPTNPYASPVGPGMPGNDGNGVGSPGSEIPMG